MNISRRRALLLCATAIAATTAATASIPALAQQPWPSRPIALVVAYPAGGDTDALARMLADKLTQRLGQPVIIENRPGASGTVGTAYVAKAPADGYTLLFTPSTFPITPHVLKTGISHSYDVVKDFTPVILAANIPNVLVAYPGNGIKDVKGLVNAAKSGKALSYGTPGAGSPMHIAAEIFDHSAGINITHVPYKGVAPAVNDVLGGHVDIAYVTPGSVSAHIAKGKLVALAITDGQRSAALPGVPTLAESGYKEVAITSWLGLLGPKGLPPEITHRLNADLNEILKMPEVISRMATLGIVPAGGEPEKLAREVASDYERFGKAVKAFDIRAE